MKTTRSLTVILRGATLSEQVRRSEVEDPVVGGTLAKEFADNLENSHRDDWKVGLEGAK